MTYIFSIDKDAEIVRERWQGTVTLSELRASCHEEWAHPDYREGFSLLSDFREAQTEMNVDEVLQFASWFSGEDTPRKHAIVVAKESGLDQASIFSMLRDTVPEHDKSTRIFFSAIAAETWLARDQLSEAESIRATG